MNIENIDQLPERYRKQAAVKMGKRPKAARQKYGNVKTEINGIKFDSKKEAVRYEELMLKLKNGELSDLRLQVNFTLVEGFTAPTGDRISPIKYIADFTYYDSEGNYIVEDVKSKITRKDKTYRIKNKLMADLWGIVITEV